MPTIRDDAVCIRHWDFSETSQTVSLFTREHGLVRGLGKGAKRQGGRFSGGIDLLTRGEVVVIVKPGRDLSTLTDWTLLASWRRLRSDLEANQAAFYAIDLVQRLLELGDPHPPLFDALTGLLDALEESIPPAAGTLAFQWILLDEVGLRPRIELPPSSSATAHFSPGEGGTCDGNVPGAWKVRRATLELLASLQGFGFLQALDRTKASGADSVQRANRLLAAFLRHHLGIEPTTMKQLFGDV